MKQLLRRRFAFGGMCPPDTFGSSSGHLRFSAPRRVLRSRLRSDPHRRRDQRSPGRPREQPRSASRRRGGRLCCHRRGGTRSACRPGLPRRGSCWSGRRASARWLARAPPFSARGASVRLRIGRIPQHLSGRATSGRKRLEEAPPDAFDCPAQEPVVQRLRRAVLARRMPPRATRAQHMDDTAEHTPVVHPRLAASLRRQERRNPPHLRLAQRDTDRSSRFPPPAREPLRLTPSRVAQRTS
jgi:hypothetical protein